MWKHKVTGERGTEPFSAVDASSGTFEVYYPAAMQEAEGAVQAQPDHKVQKAIRATQAQQGLKGRKAIPAILVHKA